MAHANLQRDAAVAIVRTLQQAGHVSYLAGGCVRDELLGLTPKDYDVATDALPQRVRELLPRSRYVGESFGVCLVRKHGVSVEVATFRSEAAYLDGRRPSHVEFTDAEHDAERRDFTINGLFEDPLTDDPQRHIIDYVGGREDLQARLIRAIGDPDERFGEDYLRMLRAVRFAATLGFTIEQRTSAAITVRANELGTISRERIGQEVRSMLTGPDPVCAARLMQELRLDVQSLQEDHTSRPLPILSMLGSHPVHALALAAWMLDRHLPEDATDAQNALLQFATDHLARRAQRWRRALCLSNDDHLGLEQIVRCSAELLDWPKMPMAQRKRLLTSPHAASGINLLGAFAKATKQQAFVPIIEEARKLAQEEISPPPWVSGQDLIALGLSPGPQFKLLLDRAYDQQLEGRLSSRQQAIRWLESQIKSAQ